jgi:hypothetical protein
MSMISNLFGDSVGAVIKGVLSGILPPPLRWLADLVPMVVEAVKLAETASTGKGQIKMNIVRKQVVAALDGLDTVPGWSKLSEESRDGLITGLAELVVFGLNVEKHGGVPPRAVARDRFADALSDITYAIFEIVDLAKK